MTNESRIGDPRAYYTVDNTTETKIGRSVNSVTVYGDQTANDNRSGLSIAVEEMTKALKIQREHTKHFAENTKKLKQSMALLKQTAVEYQNALAKINVSKLRRKSSRLAQIMDTAL